MSKKPLTIKDLETNPKLHDRLKDFLLGFISTLANEILPIDKRELEQIKDNKGIEVGSKIYFRFNNVEFNIFCEYNQQYICDISKELEPKYGLNLCIGNKVLSFIRLLPINLDDNTIFIYNNKSALFWQVDNHIIADNLPLKESYIELYKYIEKTLLEELKWLNSPCTADPFEDTNFCPTKNLYLQLEGLIQNNVKQIIINGAPYTGKTLASLEIAENYQKEENSLYEFVQFYPSYNYEKFVENSYIRTIKGKDKLVRVDGVFKAFCRLVVEANKEDKEKRTKHFFIIDEINNANLPRVFEEISFCLGHNKRGIENKLETQYSKLVAYDLDRGIFIEDDCFKDGFYIPENVFIIATMNEIDKSMDSIDCSIRRKFYCHDVDIDYHSLTEAFSEIFWHEEYKTKEFIKELALRIISLNSYIELHGKELGLNKHHCIGQGYFVDLDYFNSLSSLCWHVWYFRIKGTLKEYLRGRNEEKIEGFLKEASKHFL